VEVASGKFVLVLKAAENMMILSGKGAELIHGSGKVLYKWSPRALSLLHRIAARELRTRQRAAEGDARSPARPRPRPGPRRQHARPVRCEHPAGMLQPPKGTKELTGAKILACLRALPLSRSGFAMPAPGSLLSRETGGVAASELEMMAGVICACQARAATARAGSTVPISNWSCSPRGGTLLLHRRPLAQKLKDVHASV